MSKHHSLISRAAMPLTAISSDVYIVNDDNNIQKTSYLLHLLNSQDIRDKNSDHTLDFVNINLECVYIV